MTGKNLWTTEEYATFRHIRPQTARKERTCGGGPPFYRPGRGPKAKVYYDPDEVLEWLRTRRFGSTSEETVQADSGSQA